MISSHGYRPVSSNDQSVIEPQHQLTPLSRMDKFKYAAECLVFITGAFLTVTGATIAFIGGGVFGIGIFISGPAGSCIFGAGLFLMHLARQSSLRREQRAINVHNAALARTAAQSADNCATKINRLEKQLNQMPKAVITHTSSKSRRRYKEGSRGPAVTPEARKFFERYATNLRNVSTTAQQTNPRALPPSQFPSPSPSFRRHEDVRPPPYVENFSHSSSPVHD